MVEEKLVKNDFAKFENASISVDYNETECKYVIETGMNTTVYITEEVEFNLYNVIIKNNNGKVYDISSYNVFKDYIKKHTKKLFGKKDMTLHMNAVSEFVYNYKDVFAEEDTTEVFLNGQMRGGKDIFIA